MQELLICLFLVFSIYSQIILGCPSSPSDNEKTSTTSTTSTTTTTIVTPKENSTQITTESTTVTPDNDMKCKFSNKSLVLKVFMINNSPGNYSCFQVLKEVWVPRCGKKGINFYVEISDQQTINNKRTPKCVTEPTNFSDGQEGDGVHYIKGVGLGNCTATDFDVANTKSLFIWMEATVNNFDMTDCAGMVQSDFIRFKLLMSDDTTAYIFGKCSEENMWFDNNAIEFEVFLPSIALSC